MRRTSDLARRSPSIPFQRRSSTRKARCDGARRGCVCVVAGVHRLAKHKIAGSTPVTRSQEFPQACRPRQWGSSFDPGGSAYEGRPRPSADFNGTTTGVAASCVTSRRSGIDQLDDGGGAGRCRTLSARSSWTPRDDHAARNNCAVEFHA